MSVLSHDVSAIKKRAMAIREALAQRPGHEDATEGIRFMLSLRSSIGQLKAARLNRQLSIGEIARACETTETIIEQLESGLLRNPSWQLLGHYAHAVGLAMSLDLTPDERNG